LSPGTTHAPRSGARARTTSRDAAVGTNGAAVEEFELGVTENDINSPEKWGEPAAHDKNYR
jgi:hypothetical protein